MARSIGTPRGEVPPPDDPPPEVVPETLGITIWVRCPGDGCGRTCPVVATEPHYCDCGVVIWITKTIEVHVTAQRWRDPIAQKEGGESSGTTT